MSINSRVFGAPIDKKIQAKLRARQDLAHDGSGKVAVKPNETRIGKYSGGLDPSSKNTYDEVLGKEHMAQFGGQIDPSTRTPWVRMWTAIEVRQYADVPGAKGQVSKADYDKKVQKYREQKQSLDSTANKATDDFQKNLEALNNLQEQILKIDTSKKVSSGGAKRYAVEKQNMTFEDGTQGPGWQIREAKSAAVQVYEIGNHAFNNFWSENGKRRTTPNKTVQKQSDIIEEKFLGLYVPEEGEVQALQGAGFNEYLKPPAGITNVRSTTIGPLGLMKKTEVTFVVHNFHDYEAIYSRYFLTPGAQVFVDFGWSSLHTDLYDPRFFFDEAEKKNLKTKYGSSRVEEVLFGKDWGRDGVIGENYGEMEVLMGQVTKFDTKFKDDGTIECSLTFASKNYALLDHKPDTVQKNRILKYLELDIIKYASNFIQDTSEGATIISSEDDDGTPQSRDNQRLLANIFADRYLSGGTTHGVDANSPGVLSVVTGVYWQSALSTGMKTDFDTYYKSNEDADLFEKSIKGHVKTLYGADAKQLYVSYGFFEDKILNLEFGNAMNASELAGKGSEESNFATKFDSKKTYINYTDSLFLRQSYEDAEKVGKNLSYLYPNLSDNSSLGKEVIVGLLSEESYNNVANPNSPLNMYSKLFKNNELTKNSLDKIYGVEQNYFNSRILDASDTGAGDKARDHLLKVFKKDFLAKNIFPLREMFISVELIKSAVKKSETTEKILEYIFKEIKKDSNDIIDLQLLSNEDGTKIGVVDINCLPIKHVKSQNKNLKIKKYDYDEIFTFKPFSKNSIVTNFDLSLTTPKGAMNSMIAIQSMSGQKKITAGDGHIDAILALKIAEQVKTDLVSTIKDIDVVYLPEQGQVASDRLLLTGLERDKRVREKFSEGAIFNTKKFKPIKFAKPSAGLPVNTAKHVISTAKNTTTVVTNYYQDEEGRTKRLAKEEKEELEFGYNLVSGDAAEKMAEATSEFFATMHSTIIPLKCSLSLKGIAGITNGDIFTIDYLPEKYQGITYFQVTKITHKFGNDWETSIEAQFRINAEAKADLYNGVISGYSKKINSQMVSGLTKEHADRGLKTKGSRLSNNYSMYGKPIKVIDWN